MDETVFHLHRLIMDGNIKEIKNYQDELKKLVDVYPEAIFLTCTQDLPEVLNLLIEFGFNPYFLDTGRENIAHYATKSNSFKILGYLAQNYPSLFFISEDSVGDRPIHIASRNGNVEALKTIVKVHPLGILNWDDQSALTISIRNQDIRTAKLLLDRGSEFDYSVCVEVGLTELIEYNKKVKLWKRRLPFIYYLAYAAQNQKSNSKEYYDLPYGIIREITQFI
ncbi:unnamed protein product [Blepharisma stoltei]|uniref:Ankyrin repeat protein n=1 Tax=Blepharisma stoltei TaxID=1481888 RepID=A0AAU9JPA9_9CILI|nr:unnamed protein product [Blepharisma stoltei]